MIRAWQAPKINFERNVLAHEIDEPLHVKERSVSNRINKFKAKTSKHMRNFLWSLNDDFCWFCLKPSMSHTYSYAHKTLVQIETPMQRIFVFLMHYCCKYFDKARLWMTLWAMYSEHRKWILRFAFCVVGLAYQWATRLFFTVTLYNGCDATCNAVDLSMHGSRKEQTITWTNTKIDMWRM